MQHSKRSYSKAASTIQRSQSKTPRLFPNRKRQTTIYDAVAGRVSSEGFIPNAPRVSKNRDTLSSSTVAVPPEEALFRRRKAPERYEEDDIYWNDRYLTAEQRLPDSDLLKAIHAYASDFYGRATQDGGIMDFESLNETALLGLGILLEEMAEHVLGETGDLAFVEGEDIDPAIGGAHENSQRQNGGGTTSAAITSAETSDIEVIRKRKKRKTMHTEIDAG